MEILGSRLWSSLRTYVLMMCLGLALSVQDDQLGPMGSNRPISLTGASLTEIQCALRLLSVLRNVCGVTRFGPHLLTKRQAGFVDEPTAEILEGCVTPLQVLTRVCSLQSAGPMTNVFNAEGKRYKASEFVAARGRRKYEYSEDQDNEYPPGFLASRGRRSDGTSTQQQERERKGDGDVSNLYLNGFLGTRG